MITEESLYVSFVAPVVERFPASSALSHLCNEFICSYYMDHPFYCLLYSVVLKNIMRFFENYTL